MYTFILYIPTLLLYFSIRPSARYFTLNTHLQLNAFLPFGNGTSDHVLFSCCCFMDSNHCCLCAELRAALTLTVSLIVACIVCVLVLMLLVCAIAKRFRSEGVHCLLVLRKPVSDSLSTDYFILNYNFKDIQNIIRLILP